MVSFDVASLFTNVPLEETIEIILKRIYVNKEITADIPKQEMKELLINCTKNVHFTFENKTYIQLDCVAMGSLLGAGASKHYPGCTLKHQLYQT